MVVKQGRDNIARLGFLLSSEQLGQTEDDSNARGAPSSDLVMFIALWCKVMR